MKVLIEKKHKHVLNPEIEELFLGTVLNMETVNCSTLLQKEQLKKIKGYTVLSYTDDLRTLKTKHNMY